jgi:hypothetical protein
LSDTSKFENYTADRRVKKEIFVYLEESFNRKLKNIYDQRGISKEIYDRVTSHGSQPARLYGLPKVHKSQNNPPYRPVLSMYNAYCTNLSKWLDKILKPYIPVSRTVKDSFEFIRTLQDTDLPNNYHIVSYDVVSLFTNIPVNDTIEYIINILPDNQLPISKDTLRCLLKMSCTNITFSFDNKLYTQKDGMCMGSNLGPTMAAFAMDKIEQNLTNRPFFYRRYVDDIIAFFNNPNEANIFLEQLNSISNHIKFTKEDENNNKIVFLDVELQKTPNGLQTAWHRKNTNTAVYLNKNANSPKTHKTAAIRSLIYRAYNICSNNNIFEKCYKEIRSIFILNGYHYKYIDNIRSSIINNVQNRMNNQINLGENRIIYFKLPYIKEMETDNKKLIRSINNIIKPTTKVSIAYNTLKSQAFFPNKDKVPVNLRSSLVYQYKCRHCANGIYTGETSRHFSTRKREHLTGKPVPSEVSLHIHHPSDDGFQIVCHSSWPTITEALVYNSVTPNRRINKYSPPFELKLFNFNTANNMNT